MAALDRDVVAGRIAGFPRVAADRPELKQAAVALCVTEADGVPTLVITRRAAGLRAHAGQWALPGGRLDAGEGPVEGALRELHEEIGVDLGPGAVLGLLDDYVTRSGYVMTPVVCWAGPVAGFAGSEPEVAAVFEVPLAFLLDAANHAKGHATWRGRERHYYEIWFEGWRIWGATAAMLVNLSRRLAWTA